MGNAVCGKCGAADFVTVGTSSSATVNTIDADTKVIIISDGKKAGKGAAGDSAAQITVCKKCGDVIIGK